MKITIDSGEPLHDALRVVGALYDVELVVSDGPAPPSAQLAPAAPKATSPAGSKKASRAKVAAPRSNPRTPRTPRTPSKRSAAAKSSAPVSTIELRSWARQNGFTVSERGRVATKVIAAYRAAHEA